MKRLNFIKYLSVLIGILFLSTKAVGQGTAYFNVGFTGTISANNMTLTSKINGKNFNFSYADATNNNIAGTITYQNDSGTTVTKTGVVSKKQKSGNTLTGLYFLENTTSISYLLIVPGYESSFNTTTLKSQGLDESGVNTSLVALAGTQSTLPVASLNNPTVLENAGYAVFILAVTNLNSGSWTYTIKPTLGNITAVLGTDYSSTGMMYSENGTTWTNFTYGNKISFTNDSVQIRVPIINYNTSSTNKTFYLTTDTISATSGTSVLNNFGVYGTGTILVPTITTSGSLTAFTTCSGVASTAQSFTVSGTNLVDNVVVTAPTGYEVATASNGTYAASVTLVPTVNALTSVPVYVRLKDNAANGAGGNITITSTSSAYAPNVATGTATVKTTPTISSTTAASRCGAGTVTLTAAASAGTINWYAASTGGTSLGTGTSFTTPSISSSTTYYVDATNNGCTSPTRTSVVATVNTVPTITLSYVPSVGIGATSFTIPYTSTSGTPTQYSITAAVSGGLPGFTNVTNATLNSSPISVTIPWAEVTGTFNFNLTVKNADGCVSQTYPIQLVISAMDPGIIGSNQSICPGTSAATLTSSQAATATYSQEPISYIWQKSTTSSTTGWSNITGATSATYAPGTLTQTTYFKRISYIGTDSSSTAVITVTVAPGIVTQPVSTLKVLTGNTISLSITATGVTAYKWKKGGVDISGATSSTLAITPAELSDAGTYSVEISPSAGGCANGTPTSSVVTVVDTVYSTAAGVLTNLGSWGVETDGSGNNPTSFTNRTSHVYQLRNRSSNAASLSGNFSIAGTLDVYNTELTVGAGNTLQAGKIIRTTGGSGLLNTGGNSSITLTGVSGGTSNLYFKTGSFLKNLTLNAGAPANLNSLLSIVDSGTVTCGDVLATNNYLTLKSTVNGDASVGAGSESGGYITGNVKVERYLGTTRQWRMIGFPFSGNLVANTISPFFTSTMVAYWYDESLDDGKYGNTGPGNAGWVPFSGTATTPYSKGLLISGGNNSTINITNPLKTGTQTFSLGYSSGRPNRGWHLVANPFACKLDWDVIVALQANKGQKIAKAIYRWDPVAQGYASYINGNAAGRQSNVIENGASFFVSLSDVSVLTIPESSKTSVSADGRLFAVPNVGEIKDFSSDPATKSIVKIHIQKQGDAVTDQVVLRWGNAPDATDAFDDNYDAYDMGRKVGPDIGVLGTNNTLYSIFHGSELQTPTNEHRTIALNTTNLEADNYYVIQTELLSPLAYGNNAYIYDKYTKEYTLIEAAVKAYNFKVTADTLSQSSQRFLLVFNKLNGTAGEVNGAATNSGIQVVGNPIKGNAIYVVSNGDYKNLFWQLIDNSGNTLSIGTLVDVRKGGNYILRVNKELNTGVYILKCIGDSKTLPGIKIIK